MKKFYSTLLLVMAMLCTGANTALAGNVELNADEFKYALEEIGKSNITSLAFVDYGKEYFENNGYT